MDTKGRQNRETEPIPLGKYGQKILQYLKESRPHSYSQMEREQELEGFLTLIDRKMEKAEQRIISQLEQEHPKPSGENFLEMARWRNTVYPMAEEMIMADFYNLYPPEDRQQLIQEQMKKNG